MSNRAIKYCNDVRILIAEFTVANFCHYQIRLRIKFTSALEILFEIWSRKKTVAYFTTNSGLHIGKKIHVLFIFITKLIIILENTFSEEKFSILVTCYKAIYPQGEFVRISNLFLTWKKNNTVKKYEKFGHLNKIAVKILKFEQDDFNIH